jgi:hypothetical protein
MNKRIIDGMNPVEIVHGWNGSQKGIIEYLESICKPVPNWGDDVAFNAVLCFVGNSIHQLERKTTMASIYNLWPDPVYKYGAGDGCNWKHATPITPDDCWQHNLEAELFGDVK